MIGNYIKAVAAAVSRSTAKLMKTGQTTSYRTGDDGDIEAGRNTSFTVLAENNPFGNTNRFTDELGGQTYTKNIMIDWSTYDGSTVLGCRRQEVSGTFNSGIDACLALSIAPYTSGWRMANIKELMNFANFSLSQVFNYSPFNFFANINSSTTNPGNVSHRYIMLSTGDIQNTPKSGSGNNLAVRNFTVTGTTLS